MSAAELEAESFAQEQHPQHPQQQQQHLPQQQQQFEHLSNNSTASDAETTTYDVDVDETNDNNYDSNNEDQHMQQVQLQQQQQQQQQQLDQQGELGMGLSLMQSSPPPHSYRHSRAYRHFKNPPQPHMCIRTTTETGEELFINVLSWTRIVIPQEPSDPIPLYGGMRVPPGSPRSPPIVFAVMANPEVLKDSGRHSKDPEERRAMVELMCDFVEAMNPGVKLVRNAVILKDRDISGELKDVWNAVQAQRDREREEQMLQQRQQQHYQNITTQQMFPKSPDAARAGSSTQSSGAEIGLPPAYNADLISVEQHGNSPGQGQGQGQGNANGITLAVFAQQLDNKVASEQLEEQQQEQQVETAAGEGCVDQTDAGVNGVNGTGNPSATPEQQSEKEAEIKSVATVASTNSTATTVTATTTTTSTTTTTAAQSPATPPAATATPPPVQPTKKEKLGGFLPNGCIFPRFKNNKHKDKDSNHKESKSKEKTLLNALKKSKEKKVAPSEQTVSEKSDNGTTQYEKNCINNLECEVQKLDLNGSNNDNNMFIKLKVAPTSATTAAAAAAK
ncbi:mediator of RNA polymerase II transcription subunit 15 [Drosophila innubila]|uniref:mediator of RNA polymerase II transcription subunit 15 n=1 Tax=Drosophila innubila TaxID=198719 RepID=UPI00148CBCCD|nr:mediator of RNA polymerase II transcription subunit 15 [Drosophila innubila]XP_034483061.1 mediator of RNA polymerase II transcription subunit 15 [Drosophila innubila]XP_034483062.1 mediator of RNA polymerase II transcription subunit 15 [Drosophila innubila]